MNKPFSVNGCKHLRTSISESNLRMSTIPFVLIYIRYKGVPLIASSNELQRQMHLFLDSFLQFFVLLKVKF